MKMKMKLLKRKKLKYNQLQQFLMKFFLKNRLMKLFLKKKNPVKMKMKTKKNQLNLIMKSLKIQLANQFYQHHNKKQQPKLQKLKKLKKSVINVVVMINSVAVKLQFLFVKLKNVTAQKIVPMVKMKLVAMTNQC